MTVCAGVEEPFAARARASEPVVIKLPVRRDTVVSAASGERDANLGGARRLKTKGIVELTLFDVSVERFHGALLSDPVLHVRSVSEDVQRRVSVSTVAAEWVEGRSSGYRTEPGSASFNWAAQGERRWAYPGSDVTAVINGRGQSRWAFANASPPDSEGWQRIAVDPLVVAARVAGLSAGFALTDDVGSEYDRHEGEFRYHVFPNRFFASREGGEASAPFLTVGVSGSDSQPPGPVRLIPAESAALAALPPGETLVYVRTPSDAGAAGTLGFDVRFSRVAPFEWESAEPVPRYLIPFAGTEGERVTLRIRDLGLEPGAPIELGARAVDAAGNRGPISFATVAVSGEPAPLELLDPPSPTPASDDSEVPAMPAGLVLAVIDPLDKVHPVSGEMIPPRPAA